MPDGRIEPRQVERFREIGAVAEEVRQSPSTARAAGRSRARHDARGFNSARNRFDLPGGSWWGGSTHRDNVVYLHVLRWPSETIGCRASTAGCVRAIDADRRRPSNAERKLGRDHR